MSKIITIHSFRGGTGKSNIAANLSYTLALKEKKICLFDSDIFSPGLHILLQHQSSRKSTLNDYLLGNIKLSDTLIDLSETMNCGANSFYLVPCDLSVDSISQLLKKGYNIELFSDLFKSIQKELKTDYLIIDTHPGFNEETLLSIAMSDTLILVTRIDQQDFEGTSVTIEIAKKLKVKNIYIIINMVPNTYKNIEIREKISKRFKCEILESIPYIPELAGLGSKDLFCKVMPNSLWSKKIDTISSKFLS
ncbi:MAG: MinD/ParA family protein [bacterium]|nr:MinD/ParA family protein [bacterium]